MTQKRKHITQKIQNSLLVKAMHRCCLCPQHEDITEIHHIIPISEKGPNTEDNLLVVCPTCHEKIHRIPRMYTKKQLKIYKSRWIGFCAKGILLEMLLPSLHNQTPPEPNFVGRKEMLETITNWYKDPNVRIGALIGWGGVGKSALVRKWYDALCENNVQPDCIFWWGFYHNASLDQFLNALLRYVSQGEIDPEHIKSPWEKIERIKEYLHKKTYLIILDGFEQMQKSVSGDEFGRMVHREFTEFLHYLADASVLGLCLINTRFPLKDLDEWYDHSYKTISLVDLSIPDALAMLKKRGVKGSNENIEEVIIRYKGHALSLTSVAGYLKRYYAGDIKQAPDIEFVFSDEKRFKDVNKLLRKYAEKMQTVELCFLNIFSLFRTEITEREFTGVFRHKMGFNDMLANMVELDFKDLVNGLVDWRLITFDETKKSYSTHPLIKGYFESTFNEQDKTLCHKRIYQYIGSYAPEWPETLEEMKPLFEQVFHGCCAGLYDEVINDVYWEKINRWDEYFIAHKLGAWETNLSLVKNFFPKGDLSQLPMVSDKSVQSWLLNAAGLTFLYTGRPKEAEEILLTAIKMDIKNTGGENASVGYQTLADLQFRTGRLSMGLESAEKAFELAEKARSDEDIMASKVYLAWIFHLLGKNGSAEKKFRKADELCKNIGGHRLISLYGVFYAEFLISIKRPSEALELTQANLKICQEENLPADISRCHRVLSAIERTKRNCTKAEAHLQKALEIAKKVGVPDLEIEVLLEYGRLRLDLERYEIAIKDANEVLKLCFRTGFRLYEPDAELILARAYLAQKDFDKAKSFAQSAYDKATEMHYHSPKTEAEQLLSTLKK